jgi:hypothetical protein
VTTCAFCGATGPDDRFRLVAQVSNPPTCAPVCRGRAGCYWRAFRRLDGGMWMLLAVSVVLVVVSAFLIAVSL